MEKEQKNDDAPGRFSLLGTASTVGMHMVSGPLVGGGLGWLADSWLDTWPWGAGIGLALGIAAGFRNVWIDARYLIRSDARLDEKEKAERMVKRQAEKAAAVHAHAVSAEKSQPADIPAQTPPGKEAGGMNAASIIAGVEVPSDGADEPDETEEEIRRLLAGADFRQNRRG